MSTPQFMNNQLIKFGNGTQGENLCYSEPSIVWMWAYFFEKVIDTSKLLVDTMTCCADTSFFTPEIKNCTLQFMNNQIGPFGNVTQDDNIRSSETNIVCVWEALPNKGVNGNYFKSFCCSNNVLCFHHEFLHQKQKNTS